MNRPLVAIALPLALLSVPLTAAKAALVVSKDPSKNVTCNEWSCSATKKNANLNIGDLKKLLNARDLTLIAGADALDIDLKVPLAWTRPRALTLQANRSVVLEQPMTVQGAGSLAISTNYGGSAGTFAIVNRGRVDFWDLSGSLTINSQPYTLVADMASLAQLLSYSYGAIALVRDYDASADAPYTNAPGASFGGTLEGLGHKISNLVITDSATYAAVGLIGQASEANVRNLGMVKEKVTGQDGSHVGGLIGTGGFLIEHCYVTGAMRGGTYSHVGGLVGDMNAYPASSVTDSRSFASVAGGVGSYAGGLIANAGGGGTDSVISNSYATGQVTGGAVVGGLIGSAVGVPISDSRATGPATILAGQYGGYVGGLIGYANSDIERSFATGTVTGRAQTNAGGLVGYVGGGRIYWTYATGGVKADDSSIAGGLVGQNWSGDVRFSYTTGAVSIGAYGYAGGLVGQHAGLLSYSYSTGAVSGGAGSTLGGAVGQDYGRKDIYRVYWDTDTSGIFDPGAGAGTPASDYGIAPLTSAQLQSALPRGFDKSMWGQNPAINNGFPYLRSVPPSQ